MYRLFQDNPQAVLRGLARVLRRLHARAATADAAPAPRARADRHRAAPAPAPRRRTGAAPRRAAGNGTRPVVLDGETPQPLRGAAARIVANMEASLEVPTATSVRSVPGQAARGQPPDPQQPPRARTRGGKVSFTHLIGYAVLRALRAVPHMNSSFGVVDGKPSVVRHEHVNLGLAIDLAEGRRHAHAARPEHQAAPTRSTSPRSTPRTKTSIRKARDEQAHASTTSRARPSRSPTRARSARCTRCRA